MLRRELEPELKLCGIMEVIKIKVDGEIYFISQEEYDRYQKTITWVKTRKTSELVIDDDEYFHMIDAIDENGERQPIIVSRLLEITWSYEWMI